MDRVIIVFMMIALPIGVALYYEGNINAIEASVNDTEKYYQSQLDSLYSENTKLSVKIYKIQRTKDSLSALIDKQAQTIASIKDRRNEQIKGIDSLTTSQLYRFFAEFSP